jgi:hypothetical protein
MLRLELAALEAEVLARQVEVVTAAIETGEQVHLEELGLARQPTPTQPAPTPPGTPPRPTTAAPMR